MVQAGNPCLAVTTVGSILPSTLPTDSTTIRWRKPPNVSTVCTLIFYKSMSPKEFQVISFFKGCVVCSIGHRRRKLVETPLTPAKGYCREGRVRGPGDKASPLPSRRTWGITLLKASRYRAPNGIIQNKRLL